MSKGIVGLRRVWAREGRFSRREMKLGVGSG
jgi:hypothetical protein